MEKRTEELYLAFGMKDICLKYLPKLVFQLWKRRVVVFCLCFVGLFS